MNKLAKLIVTVVVLKIGYDKLFKKNLKPSTPEHELLDDVRKPKPIRSGRYPWGQAPKDL